MNLPPSIICLPFAGGNQFSYKLYERFASSLVRLVTIEYPGRGGRLSELLLKDAQALADDVFENFKLQWNRGRYILYGHSMGGLITYLLIQRIVCCNLPLPMHIFITGVEGPGAELKESDKKHSLPTNQFIKELLKYGGPSEAFSNRELFDFFEPILRADFEIVENYRHKPFPRLQIPMTVITGSEEDMEQKDIELWAGVSSSVEFIKMPGGHFFIFDQPERIMELIQNRLLIGKNQC